MDRKGSRPQATLLTSSIHQRSEGGPFAIAPPSHKRSHSFRRVNLVTADTDQIDSAMPQRLDVLAEALSGICVKVDGRLVQKFGNSGQWLNDAGLVVHVHD